MNKSLVSVVIPTYNGGVYLETAIKSILKQTYGNYEIFVIDDGSTDNTKELVKEKISDKLTYIWQENQGESVARNHGISIANGRLIAFLDSDDYWHPKKLEMQVNKLCSEDNGQVAGVFSPVWVVDEFGNKRDKNAIGKVNPSKDLQLIKFFTDTVIFAAPSNLLLKTECVREVGGFDQSVRYGEDKDFLLRIRSKWDLAYISKPLVFHRKHSGNQSRYKNGATYSNVLDDHIQIIVKNATLNQCEGNKSITEALVDEYIIASCWSCYEERWEDGLNYFRKACEINEPYAISKLPIRIGYVATIKFHEQKTFSLENIDDFIVETFLTPMRKVWNIKLRKPLWSRCMGWFFLNVALKTRNIARATVRRILIKSIILVPRFLISPRTMRALIFGRN